MDKSILVFSPDWVIGVETCASTDETHMVDGSINTKILKPNLHAIEVDFRVIWCFM